MMDFIDPSAPKTKDYVLRVKNENQLERIAPYRPSIDKGLAKLFEKSVSEKQELPAILFLLPSDNNLLPVQLG